MISYRVWQDLYRGDPAIVGKPIRFAEIATTIAGVAPRDFDTPHGSDFWFSQQLDKDDINHFFDGFMRLKPGVTLERANAEMASVMAGLSRDFPASDMNRAYVTKSLVASVVGDLGPILIIVMSATSLLLLLACVNVTNLLLARGAARAREMALRVALGAGRGRIIRQLLTESALLSGAGALLGGVVAYIGVRALLALGASRLPRLDAVAFDGRVLLFALATLVVSGVLVGFAPALRLAGTDVRTLMNESHAIDQRRARHRAVAERDDGDRDRARDHAGGGSGLAGARLRQPAQHRSRIRRRASDCCSTSRSSGRSIPIPTPLPRPPAPSSIASRRCRA